MAEVFSDDLNLKIGDLLSWDLTTPNPNPLSPHNPTMQMLFESSFFSAPNR